MVCLFARRKGTKKNPPKCKRCVAHRLGCSFDPVPEKSKDDQMQRVPSGASQASGSSAVSRASRSSKRKAVEVAEESEVEEVEAPATKRA